MESHAVARRMKKDEDKFAHLERSDRSPATLYGVFDGHGGKTASTYGSQQLARELQALGPSASDKDIEAAFWAADAELGKICTDGSTASILLVSRQSDGFECTLAWVGDSQAVVVEMTPEGSIVAESTRHCADARLERVRVQQTWDISKAIRFAIAEGLEQAPRTLEGVYSPESIMRCARNLNLTLTLDEAMLVGRAIERGDRLDMQRMQSALGSAIDTSLLQSTIAPRVPGGKAFLHKVAASPGNSKHGGSAFLSTPNNSQHGQTGITGSDLPGDVDHISLGNSITRGNVQSVSTAVTRAIGDWDGSRAMIPHPEIIRFKVTGSRCVRTVIASDGLWDLVSVEEASKVLKKGKTPTSCADKLLEMALFRSNSKFNELKDDTTVMVIELNPSGEPIQLAATASCCAIS